MARINLIKSHKGAEGQLKQVKCIRILLYFTHFFPLPSHSASLFSAAAIAHGEVKALEAHTEEETSEKRSALPRESRRTDNTERRERVDLTG